MTGRWHWAIGGLGIICAGCAVGTAWPELAAWIAQRLPPEKLLKIAIEVVVLLPAAFLMEAILVGWQRCSANRLLFRRSASANVDVLLYVINEMRLPRLLAAPLSFLGLSGAALVGNGILAERMGVAHLTTITSPVLGFAVYWVVRDFTFYWLHRGLHCRKFWPLHRLHHSATEMTMICAGRSNFLADLVLNLAMALPLSLFRYPTESILIAQFAVVFHGLITHSNWASDWGWFGRWVLVSPLHHRLHHGLQPDEYTRNMGTMPLWDHLFGTYAQPPQAPVAIGIQHPAYGSVPGAFAMLLPELVETTQLVAGKPVNDPSVLPMRNERAAGSGSPPM